jgi:lipopolysaccharide transport system ATP-binding protein
VSSAIEVNEVAVEYRPLVERNLTVRRAIGRGRIRESDPIRALDGISFSVERGEAFGVVGHNGAGKSTLLRVMARTLRPDEGSVTVRGKTSTLLQLGVGFNPELSGRRNIYLGGLIMGLRKREVDEIVDDVIDFAELDHAIDRPLKTYSTGMSARLGFSLSMHLEPDILLVDEVLAVGDEDFQHKSLARMQDLLTASGTIVLVSHNLDTVADFCRRGILLDHGRIVFEGPIEEVVDTYRRGIA